MKANAPYTYSEQVKNGKIQLVFSFKDENGKRKLKWVSTGLSEDCTKKALKDRKTEIIKKFNDDFISGELTKAKAPKVDKTVANENVLKNSKAVKGREQTFVSFLPEWLTTAKPTIATTSYIGYLRTTNKIVEYFNEKYPDILLCDVTGLMIQQFYNDLYGSGLTANTVKHYHALLHRAFKYAVKMDLLGSNPTEKTELPKLKKFNATFYNKDELDTLFKAFEGDRMELVVYIAAYYGLRRSEVCGLMWDAIDFDKKTLTIRRKIVSDIGNGREDIICEEQLKTEASKRTLPLIPKIEEMLRDRLFLENHYSKLLKKEFDHTYDGFVCRDNYGKLITPNFVTDHFRNIIKKNNLKKLRFHDLRHSCASLLLANGVPMKAIQEWLGHSTFNVTANFYSHLDYNSKINSAETISRVLGGTEFEESDSSEFADK